MISAIAAIPIKPITHFAHSTKLESFANKINSVVSKPNCIIGIKIKINNETLFNLFPDLKYDSSGTTLFSRAEILLSKFFALSVK